MGSHSLGLLFHSSGLFRIHSVGLFSGAICFWSAAMTEPAPALKKEFARLVDKQITTLRRKSSLSALDLLEYELRADRF